ncbi:MAG: type ISP restriction/modification enzyme [Patescibacteria group bacterium]
MPARSVAETYLTKIERELISGHATEHSYRGHLKDLIEDLGSGVAAINEPKHEEFGAPDYVIKRGVIPLGGIEAKDIGKNLDEVAASDQMDRYRSGIDNLILTDYLEFRFYREGEERERVQIAEETGGKLRLLPDAFPKFESLIEDFLAHRGRTIRSSEKLARIMASKARVIKEQMRELLERDHRVAEEERSDLYKQFKTFQRILIRDLDISQFADLYSQTIAYGMFAARLHDETPETFSREESLRLIPKSNPFLRKLFSLIATEDLDSRIAWSIDGLADVFRATDVEKLVASFGSGKFKRDPMIHFYETFLQEFDKTTRKSRGVWYTPEPIVDFIVRAVDEVLQKEFNLPEGLTDTSQVEIQVGADQVRDGRTRSGKKQIRKKVHRVQVLDPATGTGTFLAAVVSKIHERFKGQEGSWKEYVSQHLLPRVHGFELLMAPYAMAHIKLELLLREYGYEPTGKDQRIGVYLTNSLEPAPEEAPHLFMAEWLSEEAHEAAKIKDQLPIMCVIGNPPYSVSSSNMGSWIRKLIEPYKQDLNERKINIDDDYIKFIRYAEYLIEKTGYGVVAMITNNSYLDGVTHRRMREHLLKTFDQIYIHNLHGDSKKHEKAPNGGKDENVFDIQQGVSIVVMVKKGTSSSGKHARVHLQHYYGTRDEKNEALDSSRYFRAVDTFTPVSDYFFFKPYDRTGLLEYKSWPSIKEIFPHHNTGIQTKRDAYTISFSANRLRQIESDIANLSVEDIRRKYNLPKDGRDWHVAWAQKDIQENSPVLKPIMYRPFDVRYTLYTGRAKGFHGYPRGKTMRHMIEGENLGLVTLRINEGGEKFVGLASKWIIEKGSLPRGNYSLFPLYLYEESKQQALKSSTASRTPNINPNVISRLAKITGLNWIADSGLRETGKLNGFTPTDVFDYVYAILHYPTYRHKYGEYLKVDFPHIPLPQNAKTFQRLVKAGSELRELHLLESTKYNKLITTFPTVGSNEVEIVRWESMKNGIGNVWINDRQHFGNVPLEAWEFWIGGYQPAQKWLKDRKGRKLSYEDVQHWQKIIVAQIETVKLMKEIDKVAHLDS